MIDQSDQNQEGVQRLRRFFKYIFAHHDTSEQLPPPPQELVEWSQDTLLGTLAGILLGGGRQWLEERRAGPLQAPVDAPTPAHAARAMAEEQTQRLLRIFDSSLRGGFKLGGIAAVYYGVQLMTSIYRAQQDFLNSAYGGVAAGALFGAIGRSGGGQRVRSLVLGAALGGSIGIPAGMLQQKLIEMLPQEEKDAREANRLRISEIVNGDGEIRTTSWQAQYKETTTESIIKNLEASLAGSPTQMNKSDGSSVDAKQNKSWLPWKKKNTSTQEQ